MTDTPTGSIERWWGLLTDLDRQRVQEFRPYGCLPGDLARSCSTFVGLAVARTHSDDVLEMPRELVEFLDARVETTPSRLLDQPARWPDRGRRSNRGERVEAARRPWSRPRRPSGRLPS